MTDSEYTVMLIIIIDESSQIGFLLFSTLGKIKKINWLVLSHWRTIEMSGRKKSFGPGFQARKSRMFDDQKKSANSDFLDRSFTKLCLQLHLLHKPIFLLHLMSNFLPPRRPKKKLCLHLSLRKTKKWIKYMNKWNESVLLSVAFIAVRMFTHFCYFSLNRLVCGQADILLMMARKLVRGRGTCCRE